MNQGLKIRTKIFEELLTKDENRRNWEMLCCSNLPLVPFIGAGMSAWCYPTWNQLLTGIVEKHFPDVCASIARDALSYAYDGKTPDFCKKEQAGSPPKFYWMEEIAECIFDDSEKSYRKSIERFCPKEHADDDATQLLKRLRYYIGEAGMDRKRASVKTLYQQFDTELLNEGRMPEYQSYFNRLFCDVLITTNYDRALEKCYPSILSYSYKDLNPKFTGYGYPHKEHSWLYRAVMAKIKQMKDTLTGRPHTPSEVTVPDIPMLLKVHGSIEHASDIALSRSGYDTAYEGEMPQLLQEIFKNTTVIFLGYSLSEDRIMDELKKAKAEKSSIRHFAFLPGNWQKDHDRAKTLEETYGVYPIFYNENDIPAEMCSDKEERKEIYHDYCLGLFMENLVRRKMYYSQPLELLWDSSRYQTESAESLVEHAKAESINLPRYQYVHQREAVQIWKLLNSSEDCPLIAITGKQGSGRSILCQSLLHLQNGCQDMMQFFYISLRYCSNWQEFCIQLFQSLNLIRPDIPEEGEWRTVAGDVSKHCSGYWKSVLIFNYIDDLKHSETFPGFWGLMKRMLRYWKEHQTRVIFICRHYPDDIPCYTWHIGDLNAENAMKIFFNYCISGRFREITFLEKKVVRELIHRQSFCASSLELLGTYANSKGDLSVLLEEWELYYLPGDKDRQTIARILSNHLLEEHRFQECPGEKQLDIQKNILWIWRIFGYYPGIFPTVFLETYLSAPAAADSQKTAPGSPGETRTRPSYQDRLLSEKTLMFLKNCGLCRETEDENQNQLLQNMVECVGRSFIDKFESLKDAFGKNTGFTARKDYCQNGLIPCGLEDFRGYSMSPYQAALLEYIFPETAPKEDPELTAIRDILDILAYLSKQVDTNAGRMKHRKLNLVLHYEIKTVIRFLSGCLSKKACQSFLTQIIDIGYRFAHFYHYAPQHSYPLVRRLLALMKEGEASSYRLAYMFRTFGDIKRLIGQKRAALSDYNQALSILDQCMIDALETPEIYEKCIRIKAGTLISRNHYTDSGQNEEEDLKTALELYEKIQDDWGKAFYYQRNGELLFAKIRENSSEQEKEQQFPKILAQYNTAIKLYAGKQDQTGIAYILKCMGDLIRICHAAYEHSPKEQKQYTLHRHSFLDGQKFYLTVDISDLSAGNTNTSSPSEPKASSRYFERKNSWGEAAAEFYICAFYHYYSHINWRGFANVIQALGTCYRTMNPVEDKGFVTRVTALYSLAEECYRWLGDIRGLADTLDYFGYGYQEEMLRQRANGNLLEQDKYYYMALNKWKESASLWKTLDNEEKAEDIRQKITLLKQLSGYGASQNPSPPSSIPKEPHPQPSKSGAATEME